MELPRRENDINSPSQTEQAKQLSPQQAVPVSTSGGSSFSIFSLSVAIIQYFIPMQ